jgi:mono/diheme cytochrome c family protein
MQARNNHIIRLALFAAMAGVSISGCSKPQSKKAKPEATAAAADSSAVAEDNDDNLPFDLKEGKRLFNHYCAICHGESGDGTGQYYGYGLSPSPANFTDKAFMKTLSDDTMFKSISEGSAAVGRSNMCPPWGKTFQKEEIDCMITYIKTFSGK